MANVRVRGSVRRRKGKVSLVKPYLRVTKKSGSLSMMHMAARNRKPGRLPIGSQQMNPKKPGYAGQGTVDIPGLKSMKLYEIAHLISHHWGRQGKGVNFAAKPYLDAMRQMSSHKEHYGYDPGDHIVRYFLSNATGFKGPHARAIKAELKRRVNT